MFDGDCSVHCAFTVPFAKLGSANFAVLSCSYVTLTTTVLLVFVPRSKSECADSLLPMLQGMRNPGEGADDADACSEASSAELMQMPSN